jgi:hypothetical protein
MNCLGVSRTYRWLLNGLGATWAALLVGTVVISLARGRTDHFFPFWSRAAQSALLVAIAAAWALGTRHFPVRGYSMLILGGMVSGHLGDINLGRILGLPEPVILGMIVFSVGHAFYVAACLRVAGTLRLSSTLAWVAGVTTLVTFVCILWAVLMYTPEKPAVLTLGSLAYGLFLGTMVGCTVAVAMQDRGFAGLAIGGILFMVSDVILGLDFLRGAHWRYAGDVIWLSYILGQALIVFSPGAFLRSICSRDAEPTVS